MVGSYTADLLHFNQNPPSAGFPAFTAGKVSGSIPLISTINVRYDALEKVLNPKGFGTFFLLCAPF